MAWALRKGAASSDMPRVGAGSLRTEDSLMRLLAMDPKSIAFGKSREKFDEPKVPKRNLLNGNILVRRGKEAKKDSLSRGDRKGRSLN